jgi:hypothetical protein
LVSLSKLLLKEQEEDFRKCVSHYKLLKPRDESFSSNNIALFRRAHAFAFTLGLWVSKIGNSPSKANTYLFEIRSDAILLMPAINFGIRRSLRMYERAHIEDILRYLYYRDHPVEFELLQMEPKSYANMDALFSWARYHPTSRKVVDSVNAALAVLSSAYAELSITVHAAVNSELELFESLSGLHAPIIDAPKELAKLQAIFESITFLLSIFNHDVYSRFDLDEMALVGQFLTAEQKRILSSLG